MGAPGGTPLARLSSRWSAGDAARWAASTADPELGRRVYTSRLLGADPSLVLCGGGNTSVKSTWRDLLGEARPVLWVKGSGADLAEVGVSGFAPVDLAGALRLLDLESLSDTAMLRELRALRLDPDAPTPSCEALLHAFLPARFIDHSHADAALAVVNSRGGERLAAEIWGDDFLVLPYVKPGFDLARQVREQWRAAGPRATRLRGLILLHHGVFTFGDTARESYERMIAAIERARRRLPGTSRPAAGAAPARRWRPVDLARLRHAVARLAGRPLVAAFDLSPRARRAASDAALRRAAARGPLTPDHALRTKPWPLLVSGPAQLDTAVERYGEEYATYFARHADGRQLQRLDLAPRVAWLAGGGLAGFGETPRAAASALAIARHTAAGIAAAERLGGYRPLARRDVFEVEYWELEQAKLKSAGTAPLLAGKIAFVSGAARGIGRAASDALARRGAAIAGLDRLPIERAGADRLNLTGDATDRATLERAVAATLERFGGLDILVLNVGFFAAGQEIAELSDELWRRAFELNVTAHFRLLRAAIPALALAPGGGAVVVVGSRNVLAPGPGAAAYSASKAALTQLARVAALELAPRGIRVNVLHPDGVFDTDLWTPEMLAGRAARYGLTVEQYKRRNLLACEITSADVGELVAALASNLFAKTTGAQIPVDGGSDRVV